MLAQEILVSKLMVQFSLTSWATNLQDNKILIIDATAIFIWVWTVNIANTLLHIYARNIPTTKLKPCIYFYHKRSLHAVLCDSHKDLIKINNEES